MRYQHRKELPVMVAGKLIWEMSVHVSNAGLPRTRRKLRQQEEKTEMMCAVKHGQRFLWVSAFTIFLAIGCPAANAGTELDCADNSLVGQRPDGPADDFTAWASDEAVLSWPGTEVPFDYFEGAHAPICGIRWWGSSLSMVDFTPCERQSDTFTIKFYANDNGVPGTVIAAYEDVVPTKTDTGVLYSPAGFPGPYTLYKYDLTFDTCCTLPTGAGFISIMGSGSDVDQCATTTVSSSDGNDYLIVLRDGTYRFKANDMAFCLLAEQEEPAGWGIYHSQGDFSLTQGENQWYYLAWDETLEEYVEMTAAPGVNADGDRWYVYENESWIENWPIVIEPGPGFAAVRAWEAPADGTIQITHVKRFSMAVPCGGTGVDVVFLRNDEVIWGPERVDGNTTGKAQRVSMDMTTTVSAGDRIYCRVSEEGTERCTPPVITFRIGFVEDHPSGTTYIHFNDNSGSELLIPDSVTNSGKEWSTVSEGRGHLTFDNPGGSLATWDGNLFAGGGPLLKFTPPVKPLTGDFTAQVLCPDIGELLAAGDAAAFGFIVVPTGGADGGGTGTYSLAMGGFMKLTAPAGAGMLDNWTTTQVDGYWEYIMPGEPMTATVRAALRYERTGDTLSLYAAYDDDAPAVDDPTGGTFHLVNSQTILGGVDLSIMMYSAVVSTSVSFDDVYITGPMVPDYTSPAEDPGAGLSLQIENSANIANSSELIFDVAWSNDGKKIAYLAAPANDAQVDLKMFDLVTQETVTLVDFETANFIRSYGLTWSPDDEYLYFVSGPQPGDAGYGMLSRCSATIPNQTAVSRSILGVADFDPDAPYGQINYPVSVVSGGVSKLLFTVEALLEDFSGWMNLFVADLDAAGDPILPALPLTEPAGFHTFEQCALAPSGDALLVCTSTSPASTQLYLFTDIADIISGASNPIDGPGDPRVFPVDVGHNYVYSPGFSQDGTVIVYSKDIKGRYWHGITDGFTFENYYECDFDIMVNTVSDVLQGRSPVRLPKWGNQMGLKASGGGTRVAWTEAYHTNATSSVYAATVRVIGTAPLSAGVLQANSVLNDGSGTRLSAAAGTVVGGVDPAATSIDISVFTPISPLEEATLDPGAVPVVRDFGPSGISFDPPVQLRLTYTDEEIRNLNEDALHVVWMHNGEPQILPIIEADLDTNHVTVEISGFSEIGLTDGATASDLDGDGLTDAQETMDLDPDMPGVQNPFDPMDPDSTGDSGLAGPDGVQDGLNDWDGDGMTNAEEFTWGFNPSDPESYGALPLGWAAGALVMLGLGTAVLRRRTKRRD